MTADFWFLVVDIANVLCVLLIGVRVLTALPGNRNAQLVAFLCVLTACHFVLTRADYRAWVSPAYRIDVGGWRPLLNVLRNMTPGVFMILVHRLFADRQRMPAWLLAAFGLQIFLEEPVKWLLPQVAQQPLVTQVAPTALQTLFAGLALYWTLADWRNDLIEARRRGRVVLIAILSINVVASSLLLRVVIPQNSAANYQTYLALMLSNLAISLLLLSRFCTPDIGQYLDPTRARAAPASVPAPDNSEPLRRLSTLMDGEQLYREPGLSLNTLADRVRLPEYRLRRLIHDELGYRNFNAFLHAYRIKEACAQLIDPALRRTPILTIALTVGYQSLNTFNRGFRETMGVTPSAYRAEPQKADQILENDPIS